MQPATGALRLLRRRGLVIEGSAAAGEPADGLALADPALAAIAGAAVVGRVATGPRAGHLVLRLGADATAPAVSRAGRRQAHREDFDLHADTAVRAGDRRRLERLCRYDQVFGMLRPPRFAVHLRRTGHFAFSDPCVPLAGGRDCEPGALSQSEAHRLVLRFAVPFFQRYVGGRTRWGVLLRTTDETDAALRAEPRRR